MKKSDKKIENFLRESLTEVCEVALDEVAGFKWITHRVNYKDFPASLSVVCVFETSHCLATALSTHKDDFLRSLIREKLSAVNIPIKDIKRQVVFCTEGEYK